MATMLPRTGICIALLACFACCSRCIAAAAALRDEAELQVEAPLVGVGGDQRRIQHRLRGGPDAAMRRRLMDPYHMSFDKISGLTLSVPVPKAYSFPISTDLERGTYYFVWVSGVYQLTYDVKLSHPADLYLLNAHEFEAWRDSHLEPWLFRSPDVAKYCYRCNDWKGVVDVDVESRWYLVIVNHSRFDKLKTDGLIIAHGRSDNSVHRLLLGADSAVVAAILKGVSSLLAAITSMLTPSWLRMVLL